MLPLQPNSGIACVFNNLVLECGTCNYIGSRIQIKEWKLLQQLVIVSTTNLMIFHEYWSKSDGKNFWEKSFTFEFMGQLLLNSIDLSEVTSEEIDNILKFLKMVQQDMIK